MRHEPKHPITKALLNLFREICFEPESLEFVESLNLGMLDIVLHPHMRDLKILIGKKGKTILAIRHIAERMGQNVGVTVKLEIRDSFKGEAAQGKPFEYNPAFKGQDIFPVLKPMLDQLYSATPQVSYEEHEEKIYVIIDVPHEDLTLIKALGSAFYPYGYRNGRKLSFRVLDYHPEETENVSR